MYTNKVHLEFDSKSVNERFARVTVAAFATQLNPIMEEISDIKTAVSEAVTIAIVHGYEGKEGTIYMDVEISGNKLSLRIHDDGVGIAEEDLPHVFERAYAGRGGQSGLGLAIAQAAAAQMHGSLHAGNAENGGAEFVLMFDGVGKG